MAAIRMVRKQVYIEARQDRLLKQRARQLGLTEAELIRRSLDQGLVGAAGHTRNAEAWKDVMRLVGRRLRMKVPQRSRRWTRDDLYDRWPSRRH
jgi:hypothetical protein